VGGSIIRGLEVEFRDGSVRSRYLDLWQRDRRSYEDAFGRGRPYSAFTGLPMGVSDFLVYEGDLYELQLTGFYVLTDTLVVRRTAAENALRFAEDLPTYEDLECFYRLSALGPGALLDFESTRQVDHPNDRLSQRAALEKIEARITLLRRIWGADARFLDAHRALYRRCLDELLVQKAGALIVQGQNRQARAALREAKSAPAALRFLSRLPSSVTTLGLRVRKAVR